MSYEIEDKETTTIVPECELNVRNAARLKESLESAVGSARFVELDFQNVESVDLSCLQLICSTFKTSSAMGVNIAFKGGLPDVVLKAAGDAGYVDLMQCGGDKGGIRYV